MTDLGNTLCAALEKAKSDINTFSWKYKNGTEVKLVNMTSEELQKCYNHVIDMLYNKKASSPGKMVIKENIKKTYNNVNAELFLRFILHDANIDSLKTNKDVLKYIVSMKKQKEIKDTDNITELFGGVLPVFETITIDKLMSACFDRLDVINRKMISDKFIISQGIWLTEDEKKELTEYDENGQLRKYLDVIKERLFLNDNIRLKIDSRGLSYNEFRNLINIQNFSKTSIIPTATLKLLRDKVLLLLDNDVDYHINKWMSIKKNIEIVAQKNNYELTTKEY